MVLMSSASDSIGYCFMWDIQKEGFKKLVGRDSDTISLLHGVQSAEENKVEENKSRV